MIAAIGISVVDHIMIVNGFNKNEGSFYSEKYLIEGGGMAATALCAASKLGSDTLLFSRIGDDINGKFILDELGKFGVETSGVVVLPGQTSPAGIVMVDVNTGEKQFYSERIKNAYADTVKINLSLLEDAKILLLDGHWIEAALKGARYAKSNGIPVVADFKRMYEGIEILYPYIDYFIIPSFFAEEITSEQRMEPMLEKLTSLQPGIPVITQGSNGGTYIAGGKIKRYRAFEVDVVDSTGAGDAFHGAFCHFLSIGYNLETCLNLASAVGALNCRSYGGRCSLPSCEELSFWLKSFDSQYILENNL